MISPYQDQFIEDPNAALAVAKKLRDEALKLKIKAQEYEDEASRLIYLHSSKDPTLRGVGF